MISPGDLLWAETGPGEILVLFRETRDSVPHWLEGEQHVVRKGLLLVLAATRHPGAQPSNGSLLLLAGPDGCGLAWESTVSRFCERVAAGGKK